jgi:coenzyme F420-reducing hydrogenase delta subunit/ferredoxin
MMFEPKIIAFLCTWCSYTGADTAGIARMKSPPNLRAIRVPCSGRVSPELVMRAFDQGADGVLVLGCHIGECHYDTGNHRTAKRIPILRSLMAFTGLEPERLRLDWVSASEGERFARIATEFVETVRALGPVKWKVNGTKIPIQKGSPLPKPETQPIQFESETYQQMTTSIRARAKELLSSGQVGCVIGFEVGPRGRTRPLFAQTPEEADKLVWNSECVHNLTTYLSGELKPRKGAVPKPVAVVVKPCDSRAINVLAAEKQIDRGQVHAIGVACDGVAYGNGNLQARCAACADRSPLVHDTLIGTPPAKPVMASLPASPPPDLSPAERMDFWLTEFDRCIRCYACRQACPMCNCPTCLYERDDSLWVGMGIGVDEKRTFHLGRAYHLAGRCVGCNQCEQACPMEIPISLLNQHLAQEMETIFGFRAGQQPVPSPIVTVLAGEYKEG